MELCWDSFLGGHIGEEVSRKVQAYFELVAKTALGLDFDEQPRWG